MSTAGMMKERIVRWGRRAESLGLIARSSGVGLLPLAGEVRRWTTK